MGQCVLRHERDESIGWILDYCCAPELLHRPESSGAVVEIARQDNADNPRAISLRGRAEEGVNGRADAVLLWSASDAYKVRFDEQVPVGRGDVDCTGSNTLAILRAPGGKSPGVVEYLREHAGCLGRSVQHGED